MCTVLGVLCCKKWVLESKRSSKECENALVQVRGFMQLLDAFRHSWMLSTRM